MDITLDGSHCSPVIKKFHFRRLARNHYQDKDVSFSCHYDQPSLMKHDLGRQRTRDRKIGKLTGVGQF